MTELGLQQGRIVEALSHNSRIYEFPPSSSDTQERRGFVAFSACGRVEIRLGARVAEWRCRPAGGAEALCSTFDTGIPMPN